MERKQNSIGASEFAATLNGDDPHEILRVLKLFAKTVQKERQLALFDEQDESESDSSDDEEDDVEDRPTKKLKKDEQWKEDSASYNVPFVGTAVSRSDVSQVIRGQWPTGLLGAYLTKSPLAIELMNDDIGSTEGKIHKSLMKKKHAKTSRAIKKAYLNAMTQLLTAVIPMQKLREQDNDDNDSHPEEEGDTTIVKDSIHAEYGKFLPCLLKKRLPEFFDVLNEETSRGGCGTLAAPALRLIQNIVSISTSNARLVSKYLDEKLHHGVLRCLLRPPPNKTDPKNDKEASTNDMSRRIEVRAEALELTNLLLKTQDTAVNTYICTSGSKERKVKPGILFIAMREGISSSKAELQSSSDDDEADYMDAVADLLESFRVLVLNQHKSMNHRLISELLSGEPIQHLSQLLIHAPALNSNNTFLSVLTGQDSYDDDMGSLPNAGVEARRIVFHLLYDTSRSPFLSSSQQGRMDTHQLGKIMLSLLGAPSGGKGLQRFLIACAQKVPSLVPTLFRVLNFPDPKRAYDFVITAHFVTSLLHQGPSVADCLTGEEGSNLQEIILAIFPTKFRKQAFAKAIQSKNSLVVMGCLMLFNTVLERLGELRTEAATRLKWSDEFVQEVIDATLELFPEIQVLLKIRTNFDAFTGSKESAVVNQRLFQVVMVLVKVSPSSVASAPVDWMKQVPNDAERFFKALPMVQRSLLRALGLVIEVWECPSHSIFQAFKSVVEIMLNTQQRSIYTESKLIASGLLFRMLQSRWTDANSESYIRYESECWINGLTIDSLPAFCVLLRDVTENELQIVAKIGSIWSKCKAVGPMVCSLLLFASWTSPEPIPAFAKLVTQVSTRTMLFHRSPLVVGHLIHLANQESSWSKAKSVSEYAQGLVQYASLLCEFDNSGGSVGFEMLGKVLMSLFGKNDNRDVGFEILGEVLMSLFGKRDLFLIAFNWVHEKSSVPLESLMNDIQSENAPALARFLIHLFVIAEEDGQVASRCWTLILNVAAKILTGPYPEEIKNGIICDISLCSPHDHRLPLLVASCPTNTCAKYTHSSFTKHSEALTSACADGSTGVKDRRISLLKIFLLWDSIPMNFVAKSQLEAIRSSAGDSKSSNETSIDFAFEFLKRTNSIWETADCDAEVLRSLFLLWWEMSSSGSMGVQSQICWALSTILENGDSLSAMVVALIQSRPLDDFVFRCLSSDFPSGSRLLTAAFRSDPFLLGSKIVQNLDDSNLSTTLTNKGDLLDSLLTEILQQPLDSLGEENLHLLYEKVFERIKEALSGVVNGDHKLSDVHGALVVLRTLLQSAGERMRLNVPPDILQNVGDILETGGTKRHPGIFELCSVAVSVVEKSEMHNQLRLKSLLFLRLSEWIALGFKEELKVPDRNKSCLALLLLILQDAQSFDLKTLKSVKPAVMSKIVRSCLKYGIGQAEQMPSQSSLSLELVTIILDRFGNPSSHLEKLDCLGKEPFSSTFNLLTSHSKFGEVLSSRSPEVDLVKLQMIKLMSSCVRFSPQGTILHAEVWTSLFTAFDAGLSELDTELRRLFMACCDLPHESEKVCVPYLEEFRWKSCVEGAKGEKANWDWLVGALDPVRLRATVSHFPIHDSMDISVEAPGNSSKGKDDDEQSFDDEMSVNGSASTGESVPAASKTIANQGDQWTHDYADMRYSPAFVLPLVLGALESTLPDEETMRAETENSDDVLSNSSKDAGKRELKGLVRMAQKLCDAGVHSLCLAALASKCDKVRQFSFAILGVLLLGCSSEEARSLSSWRSRPQVAMLLNSVQRAFVIKKATNRLNGVNISLRPLSPLVSTFLARASISVQKPEDALFVPLNRFFLKNEKDHGAFQDMSRLPGFISLFCSVADDPSQSRQERIWALKLVRDGFRDASCYRLIAECHAPELMLTSFENLRHSQLSDAMKDSEYALIITAFKQMFLLGSGRVMSHLLSRVGLLSWIRAWCTTWPLKESFPKVNSRVALCELVGCIAEQASINEPPRTDSFLYELCALAEPMILLGLGTKKTDEGFANLIKIICRALESIKRSVTKHKGEYPFSDVHPLGLSINTSLDFWKLSDSDTLNHTVVAMSTVPLKSDQPNGNEASSMISMLLRSFQPVESMSDDQVVLMNRILLVLKQFGTQDLTDSQILRDLLAVRPAFVTSKQRLDLFNTCLRCAASQSERTSCRESEIAFELLGPAHSDQIG